MDVKAPPASERKFSKGDDLSKTLDISMIDPTRLQEVNTLLRRAPQRFENPIANAPGPFVETLDPEVDEVVTSLRTGDVMNVERVRQLQNILQTYEQGLQTKELIAKRKQLQLLQDELVQQRKRIEEQERMEEELRKKVIGALAEHGFIQERTPVLNAKLSAEMPSIPVQRSEPTSAVEDDVCLKASFTTELVERIQRL
ncbi:hypothetical protein ANCCAN_12656 [Ancylostoma caninum]|uniref:Uncharacterized protein n=1 Tax=Ancylostoma caninum TaxID=29170 RepID=A0A368GDQ0_ANCCA|nr:hypothetical protein ANCCAN_12656 [Ancylostoma caninum]